MIPKTDSIADKIGHYLHKFGKCSLGQLRIGLGGRGVREDSIEKVSRDMFKIGQIEGDPSGYELSGLLRKHYDYAAPTAAYVGEIVPSRQALPFRPLSAKNIPALQPRREPIREVGFKNGSTDFKSFIGFTV